MADKTGADRLPGRMRKYRDKLGMTMTEAAEAGGMAYPEWQRFETGVRGPSFKRLRGIAKALRVPIWRLFK